MILAIVGPTGVGKSEAALEIARRISAEIISVDSMQVYRGMEIGTGKPSQSVRREIPHHGLDLVAPEEEFDAARYAQAVAPAIQGIRSRGRLPLLVGGTGLYFRALLDGLCQAPQKDPALRQQLWEEGIARGSEALHARLKQADPEGAARIHPNDLKKIIRSLEVFLMTGKPMTVWQKETTAAPLEDQKGMRLIGLTMDRDRLCARIEARIDGWIQAGWLEEVKGLARRPLSQTAREALGYRELLRYLQGGADWESTVDLIKRNTCQYAKRQLTWFRANPRVRWIAVDGLSLVL